MRRKFLCSARLSHRLSMLPAASSTVPSVLCSSRERRMTSQYSSLSSSTRVMPVLQRRIRLTLLSREQAAALLDQPFPQTPTGLRDRAVLEVLYGCGLRASELCGLDRRAVLLDEELLRVFGKGSKERLVPILGTAAASLRAYLEEGRGALVGRMPTPAVFLNVHGGRLSRQSVHAICEKYGRVAGIKGLHPHTLRHSFATELLGHADISTTQLYTHLDRSHIRRVYLAAHPRAHLGE